MKNYEFAEADFKNVVDRSNEEGAARVLYMGLKQIDKIIYCFGDRLSKSQKKSIEYLIKRSESSMISRGMNIESCNRLGEIIWKLIEAIAIHSSRLNAIRYLMTDEEFYTIFDAIECNHIYYQSEIKRYSGSVHFNECRICHKPQYIIKK